MPFKDHFQTLRVSHRATPQQVQKAYYDRLKFFHPDYFQDDSPRRAIAEAETKCLNEAYEVLGKAGEREQYITEWERHQNPHRPTERSLALEQSLLDVRTDLNQARRQVSELKSTLVQRERELEAANLGVRQGYQRVTHLQEAAQTFQESARQLQAQLMERELELQQASGRAEGLERHVKRLQAEMDQAREDSLQARETVSNHQDRLAEAERNLAERQKEVERLRHMSALTDEREARADPTAVAQQAEEWRSALAAAQESLRMGQALLAEKDSRVQQLGQSISSAEDRAQEQRALLEDSANEIRALKERLDQAESDLRRKRAAGPSVTQLPLIPETEAEAGQQKSQVQELAAALAQRTDEARQAHLRAEELEERLRALETAGKGDSQPAMKAGAGRRLTLGIDRAAGWLNPQRATTIMTGLMLALCAVAVTLVLLTVSVDLPALASGLGRLGPALSGLVSR